jgi:DNA-binding CsgD family transcriptional regulator
LFKDYQLSKKEYQGVLEFLEHLAHPTEHFRYQIQYFLSKIFGYNQSVLWFTDEAGNISYPHLYQIQDKVIYDYLANYDDLDLLHPKKHLDKIPEQKAFCIHDIVPIDQFEKSEYFRGFINKHHFHDETVVNFTCQNKLVGTLGLLRAKDDPPFNRKDMRIFEAISTFISQKIFHQIVLRNLEQQKKLLEAHADKSPLGLIILDWSFRPLYYNTSAKNITSELLTNEEEKTIDFFLKKYSICQQNRKLGFVKSVISPSLQKYTIHFDLKSEFHEDAYVVYLIPGIGDSASTPWMNHKFSILTSREIEIAHLVRKGYTNQEIAEQLFNSINTVKRHIQNIFSKLEVKNRTGLLSQFEGL